MSVDILGTSGDQCRSMVQYSFTSTETRRFVRTDSPGRPPRLSHSSWTISTYIVTGDNNIYPATKYAATHLDFHPVSELGPFLCEKDEDTETERINYTGRADTQYLRCSGNVPAGGYSKHHEALRLATDTSWNASLAVVVDWLVKWFSGFKRPLHRAGSAQDESTVCQ